MLEIDVGIGNICLLLPKVSGDEENGNRQAELLYHLRLMASLC